MSDVGQGESCFCGHLRVHHDQTCHGFGCKCELFEEDDHQTINVKVLDRWGIGCR